MKRLQRREVVLGLEGRRQVGVGWVLKRGCQIANVAPSCQKWLISYRRIEGLRTRRSAIRVVDYFAYLFLLLVGVEHGKSEANARQPASP